jgi:signal transduction histidine kinase/DNA-binding response OmpR family regulator/ligand-binding sensor domain-containing protein
MPKKSGYNNSRNSYLPFRLTALFIPLLLIAHTLCFAQPHKLKFTNISTEEGLSENTVLDMVQDPYGYMWFATENGLTRFDGINCTVYRNDPNDPSSIANDITQSLCIHGDELFIASVYPTIVSAFDLTTEKFRVIFKSDQIDGLETAYLLNNNDLTLLITHSNKYIYDTQLKKFVIYESLNSLISDLRNMNVGPGESFIQNREPVEYYSLDENNQMISYISDLGILEISLPELNYTFLFNYLEFNELYHCHGFDEFTSTFLFRDSEKRIWFNINNNDLGFFHHVTKTFHSKLQDVFIKGIFEDYDNNIWFASESGVLFYDTDLDIFSSITHNPSERYSLSNNYISSVFMDNHEILWVGHDGGGVDLARYYSIKHFKHIDTRSERSLLSNRITQISESPGNQVWISTDRGLNSWDINRNKFTSYLEGEFIRKVYCDSKGNIWCINSDNEILFKKSTDVDFRLIDLKEKIYDSNYPGNPLVSFFEDSKNRFWLIGNGIFQLDRETFAVIKNENCSQIQYASNIKEDKKGNFWIAGSNDRLIVINPDKRSCYYYSSDINDPYSLNSNILWDLFIDEQENLWVATNKGINKTNISNYIDSDRLQFESFTLKDGLNDEIVFRIIEDDNKDLWFATNNGLSKLIAGENDPSDENTLTRRFSNYFTLDGIASNSIGCFTDNMISYQCGIKLSGGEFLLGSSNGITRFKPDLFPGNRYQPPVLITDLKISNKSVPIGQYGNREILSKSISVTENVGLSYTDKVFSFDFIALEYANPRANQYKYILEGFNSEWIHLGNQQMVTFTNIPGGDYVLKIRASNNEGYWNSEVTTIGISIKPPFWKTWWFRIIGISFLIGSLVLFYFIRTSQIEKQKRILKLLVQQRTSEIELKNKQLEDQTTQLNKANIELEEKKRNLEHQSEKLRVINTSLANQKTELEKLNKKVETANQAKLKFFTNISHELRTPLTLIIGPIESILSRERLSENSRNYLEMMHRNTNRLLKLINQLLDFRKLETEHIKLSVAEGNIVNLLKDIYLLFSDLARQKNIKYSFNSQIENLITWYDADKIEKIISNLLSNAFKHTSDGGFIELTVNVPDHKSCKNMLRIIISDTGKGIPESEIDHIFELYYSSEDFTNREASGAGIGLALSKKLVELHKGKITVESKVSDEQNADSGTTFQIELPIGKEQYKKNELALEDRGVNVNVVHPEEALVDVNYPDPDEPENEADNETGDDLPKILVVEDNPDMRDFIKSILCGNYWIDCAENGKEGIDILQGNQYSLIISDVMMPIMDGIELCKYVKEDINTSHIPLILLTAKSDIESQISGLKTGADDYITKPFNAEILIEKINNLIQLRKRLWERFNNQVTFMPDELTSNSVDIKLLNRAKNVTEIHLSNPDLNVNLFSKELGMSKSILYEKLKNLTGKTINDFISSIRLKKAAELIMVGELNLSEISMEVGYLDPNYFSKCFLA